MAFNCGESETAMISITCPQSNLNWTFIKSFINNYDYKEMVWK